MVAAASEHVATYLDWPETHCDPLDDEMVSLLIDVCAAVLTVALPLRMPQKPDSAGVQVVEAPPSPQGRSRVLVQWLDRYPAIRDDRVWKRGIAAMNRALAEVLDAHGFEAALAEDELEVMVCGRQAASH